VTSRVTEPEKLSQVTPVGSQAPWKWYTELMAGSPLIRTLGIAVFVIVVGCGAPPEPESHQVLRVIDGDTIEIMYEGKKEKVRLLNIDTPKLGKIGYEEATYDLKTIIKPHKSVYLHNDEFGPLKRDRYGRLLAYVGVIPQSQIEDPGDFFGYYSALMSPEFLARGTYWFGNLSIMMVNFGHSKYYTKYGKSKRYDKEFGEAEVQAKGAKRGLWVNRAPMQAVIDLWKLLKAGDVDLAISMLALVEMKTSGENKELHQYMKNKLSKHSKRFVEGKWDLKVLEHRIIGDCAVVIANEYLKEGRPAFDLDGIYLIKREGSWRITWNCFKQKYDGASPSQLERLQKLRSWCKKRKSVLNAIHRMDAR